MSEKVVRVGIGVLVQDPSDPTKVICGVRKNSHGAGSIALPGGHLVRISLVSSIQHNTGFGHVMFQGLIMVVVI